MQKHPERTRGNIQQAFREWWKHCDTHADIIAIFYFCGHGLEADEQYVLASDFGADEEFLPWQNVIAIDTTIKGLWRNKAQTQCVFVDACREVTEAGRSTPKISGSGLKTYVQGNGPRPRHTLEIRAVAAEERAFARPESTSYFTAALVAALEGAAAEEDPQTGEWVVSTTSMTARFFDVLAEVAPHRTETPQPLPGWPTVLYRPPKPPTVNVTVDCDPRDALRIARLSCMAMEGDAKFERAEPEPSPWTQLVPAGYYRVVAKFGPGAEFANRQETLLASPPRRGRMLRVWR